ncbi:MAG TPA: hypothetical protein VFB32_17410 [Rudaea sp.]|nr:hypothetical protein [Rudaea sp.]
MGLPSIYEAKEKLTSLEVDKIATYLRGGVAVFDVMEATRDPFDPKIFIQGGPSLLSDGFWVWREDLAHYVERYRVGLPAEFITHVEKVGTFQPDASTIRAGWKDALDAYDRAAGAARTTHDA